MAGFRLRPHAIRVLAEQRDLQRYCQEVARTIVREAQKIAAREAYDSGAYHDSMHTEPDQGMFVGTGSRGLPGASSGIVYAVAGGAVNPRYAPRAGVTRGPDVDYAAPIEVGHGNVPGLHIMRRAAEKVAD